MSAAVQAVSSAPHVVPAVQVVTHTVTKYVVDHSYQVGQFALYIGTGIGASIIHSLLKRDGFSATVNNAIAIVYSILIAVVDLYTNHGGVNFANILVAYLAVYGASQTWYSALFVLNNAENKNPANLPVATPAQV